MLLFVFAVILIGQKALFLTQRAPFLLLQPETIAYERAVKSVPKMAFAPNIRLQLDQLATAYRVRGAGLGVTLLSDTVVRMSNHDEPCRFYKAGLRCIVYRDIAVMWKKKRDNVSKTMEEIYEAGGRDVFRLNTL